MIEHRTRGFLIIRVSQERSGKDTVALKSKPSPLGEPTFLDVQKLANQHGFEIRTILGYRPGEHRRDWPLTVFAYTSRRADGVGRSGSSLYAYPAKVKVKGGTDGGQA